MTTEFKSAKERINLVNDNMYLIQKANTDTMKVV